MSLTIALQNAASALRLNQTALQVISDNVANANTVGYSRKQINQETRILDGRGSGVDISSITRTVNESLLTELRTQMSARGMSTAQSDLFSRMQEMLGTPDGASGTLTLAANTFEAKLQTLATTPESADAAISTINAATAMATQLNGMSNKTQSLRLKADQDISAAVGRINTQLDSISQLNALIAHAHAVNQPTTDFEDSRDQALQKLSQDIDFTMFKRDDGGVVLLTSTGRTLLDGQSLKLSHSSASNMSATITAGNGIAGIMLAGADITSEIKGGSLAGLIDMRDNVLPNFQTQLDGLAANLRDSLNAVHNQGAGFPPAATLTGSRIFGNPANDLFNGTGVVRIAVVTSAGNFAPGVPATAPAVYDLDLTALGAVSINALATNITANLPGVTASIVNGKLQLAATGGNRVAIQDSGTAETTTGKAFSDYFGLNDLFTSAADYSSYRSTLQTSGANPLGSAGTLEITFAGMTAAADVAYTANTTLAQFATAITAAIAAQGGSATASVVTDGTGVRLAIGDPAGNPLHLVETGAGTVVRDLGLDTTTVGTAVSLGVRPDIAGNPQLLSRGQLTKGVAAVKATAIAIGDGTIAQALANKFSQNQVFTAAGGLPQIAATFAGFGANIVSANSAQASTTKDQTDFKDKLVQDLSAKTSSISGVNIDEELANLTVFQNAYAASARVMSVASAMLDILTKIGI